MVKDGVQLVFSTSEQGLWWDSDPHFSDPVSVEEKNSGGSKRGFGVVLKFRGGDVVYPSNQRVIGNWKIRKLIKWPVLPFLSLSWNDRGFYVGFKDFRADASHAYLGLKDGDRALTPSIRFTGARSK